MYVTASLEHKASPCRAAHTAVHSVRLVSLPSFFPASVIKESVWVCDCACVNRRAIFACISACVLFIIPSEERERGEKKQDQSKAIEDQRGQTSHTPHHWTRATDATSVMFVNATGDQILSHFTATDHSPDLQKLVSGVDLKVHVVGFIADVIECNQFVLFWFIKLICWIEGL